ncbi:hypothetical protein ACMD2_10426 [Ananas comosus]|uniref:Uncharacterized protein n=1 Tax=Ananas comosus TaxID=4615 RepID=A0A199UTT7_ANACO|nr:hypothetical protein ACMD2_10426 [Ananas comosus]
MAPAYLLPLHAPLPPPPLSRLSPFTPSPPPPPPPPLLRHYRRGSPSPSILLPPLLLRSPFPRPLSRSAALRRGEIDEVDDDDGDEEEEDMAQLDVESMEEEAMDVARDYSLSLSRELRFEDDIDEKKTSVLKKKSRRSSAKHVSMFLKLIVQLT